MLKPTRDAIHLRRREFTAFFNEPGFTQDLTIRQNGIEQVQFSIRCRDTAIGINQD